MPTVSTSVLREITEKVKPPRVLFIDRPLGYPLGEPNNPDLQKAILRRALAMLSVETGEPRIEDYESASAPH